MALFFGIILTYPLFAALTAAAIVVVIIVLVVQSGEQKRAQRKEMDDMIEKMRLDKEAKRALVIQRYDPVVAEKILKQEIWLGMTAEQLSDSAGTPGAVEETVTKRTKKEVWKYDDFGMRVTLENGVVVSWKQK